MKVADLEIIIPTSPWEITSMIRDIRVTIENKLKADLRSTSRASRYRITIERVVDDV